MPIQDCPSPGIPPTRRSCPLLPAAPPPPPIIEHRSRRSAEDVPHSYHTTAVRYATATTPHRLPHATRRTATAAGYDTFCPSSQLRIIDIKRTSPKKCADLPISRNSQPHIPPQQLPYSPSVRILRTASPNLYRRTRRTFALKPLHPLLHFNDLK